jgi:NADPH:quinone reductase-like Zn-dependent oxidoreductase
VRTLTLESHGRDGLRLTYDAPAPIRSSGEVLVQVVATSVNPVDLKTRNGTVAGGGPDLPSVLGWDLAGVVVDAGTSSFKPGDRVMGMALQLAAGAGAWADMVALPETGLVRVPRHLSLPEAAALPLPGLTALQAVDALHLAPGDRLLVVGAVGAVGGLAVQIAASRGVVVDGLVAREGQAPIAGALGANSVFLSSAEVPAACYDAVLDTAGIDVSAALKSGSTFLTIATENDAPTNLDDRDITLIRAQVHANHDDLIAVADLADSGALRPRVAHTAPLREYVSVLDAFEAGGLDGAKLVLLL